MPGRLPVGLALALLLIAGCQGVGSNTGGDPLLGGTPALSLRSGPPYNHGPSGSSSPTGKAPAVPTNLSSPNLATAAGQQSGGSEASGSSTSSPVIPPPPSPSGASLAAPQALEGTTARSGPTAPLASTPWAAAPLPQPPPPAASSFEQLQKQLEQRGMRYQWLQQSADTGEWKFQCSVLTDPRTPDLLTTYQQSSYGDYGIGAMRDVLQKIDQDRLKAK